MAMNGGKKRKDDDGAHSQQEDGCERKVARPGRAEGYFVVVGGQ